MALVYSVAAGGFVQVQPEAIKYLFPLSGELEIPAGQILPYQYVKTAFTITSMEAVFSSAGTATYTIIVTSTAANGTGDIIHVNAVDITPLSGQAVSIPFTNASLAADRILRVTVIKNSGTPSTDLTITIE